MTVLLARDYAEDFRKVAAESLEQLKAMRKRISNELPNPNEWQQAYIDDLDDTIRRGDLAQSGMCDISQPEFD